MGVTAKLQAELRSEAKHKKLIQNLITQGLLMLLEDDVSVQCREVDQKLVQSCLADAAASYAQVIKQQTGVTKSVKLSIERSGFLAGPPGGGAGKSCIGGVVLSCSGGMIKVNNTLDERMKLTMELDKPAIRGLLFPVTR